MTLTARKSAQTIDYKDIRLLRYTALKTFTNWTSNKRSKVVSPAGRPRRLNNLCYQEDITIFIGSIYS